MTGVIKTYYYFLQRLRRQRRKVAALQLSGKLEHWLLSEYVYHLYKVSRGQQFAVTNTGIRNRNEKKIDLVVLSGKLRGGKAKVYRNEAVVRALIEAKYFCNLRQLGFGSACDEIASSLKSLSSQLYPYTADSFRDFNVRLRGHQDVYGLIFASHVQTEGEAGKRIGQERQEFLRTIYKLAQREGFRYHDVKRPWLKPVFEHPVRVTVLDRTFTVSLYAGLWRKAKGEQRAKAMVASAR